jgi:hypothetical protein
LNVQRFLNGFLLVLGLMLPWGGNARAYSLLTHEQLIDLTWKDSIVPLLLSRYPNLTEAQLDEARAYAYGGCVIQDIGYYPFGDLNYSNLTHYVRTGDFVINLFRNAHNPDELAFAVGALSHYIGDSIGHPEATNRAVPIEFPKLRAEYGPDVNYAEGEHQHVQAEFAFDINEVLHHRVAPIHYLRHIGLGVPLKQLALAFYQTYGVGEDFTNRRGRRVNVNAYRFAVRSFIPRIAYAVAVLHRHRTLPDPTTPDVVELEREAAAVADENNWQAYRKKAGLGTYLLAGFLFVAPKFGQLRMVDIKGPTAQTEADYAQSVARSTAALRTMLARFTPPRKRSQDTAVLDSNEKGAHLAVVKTADKNLAPLPGAEKDGPVDVRHPLPNRDLDTGNVVHPGGYSLTDSTYAHLLHLLTRQPSVPIPPGIKVDIQAYYADPNAPITTKKNPQLWAQVQADLGTLSAMSTNPEPEPYPTYDNGDMKQ